jgi:hypothetical protein
MYRLAIKKHLSSDLSSLGGRSPREISDKNKIKEILGLPRSVSYPAVIEGTFDPQFLSFLTYLPAPSGGSVKNMKWAESDKAKRNRGNGQKRGNAE